MNRLTERDEYGNADVIALSDVMSEIYSALSFNDTNALTAALNKLADYEDAEEHGEMEGERKGMRFTDEYGEKREYEEEAYCFGTEFPDLVSAKDDNLWQKAKKLKGFIGVHPSARGVAVLFREEADAIAGRAWFIGKGRSVGKVVPCYVNKVFLKQR